MKLRKRELAAIIKLVDTFGIGCRVNLGLVLETLEKDVCMSRKVAKNSLKRLAKLGFLRLIRDEREVLVMIEDPLHVLRKIAGEYLSGRKSRCSK